ncbi:MAG: hypothetical protein Q9165_006862 [Trypethelium subeluteriae]
MSYSTQVSEDSLEKLFQEIKLTRFVITMIRSRRAVDEETYTNSISELERQLAIRRTEKEVAMSRHNNQLARLITIQTGNLEKFRANVNPDLANDLANDLENTLLTENHPRVQPGIPSPPLCNGLYADNQYSPYLDLLRVLSRADTTESSSSKDATPIASTLGAPQPGSAERSSREAQTLEDPEVLGTPQRQQQSRNPRQAVPVSPPISMASSSISEQLSDVVCEPATSPPIETRTNPSQPFFIPRVGAVRSSGATKPSETYSQKLKMAAPEYDLSGWSADERRRADLDQLRNRLEMMKLEAKKAREAAAKTDREVERAQDDEHGAYY